MEAWARYRNLISVLEHSFRSMPMTLLTWLRPGESPLGSEVTRVEQVRLPDESGRGTRTIGLAR